MMLRSNDGGASSHCRNTPYATQADTPTMARIVRCRRTNSRRKMRSWPIGVCRVRTRSRVRPTMISPCSISVPVSAGTRIAVDTRAVSRAEVAHADTPVLLQCQQRMLRCRMLVLDDDGAADVTTDAAFRAAADEALPQDPVPVRVDLLDQHHGVHCRAPR